MTKESTTVTGDVDTGTQTKKPHFRYLAYLLLSIVIVIAVLFLVFKVQKSNSSSKAVFTVNGQQYSQAQVNNIIAYPLKFQPKKVQSKERNAYSLQLYNYIRRQQAAIKLNIVPTASQISQAELTVFGKAQSGNLNKIPWIKFVSYDTALQQELSTNNLGTYAGYSFIFWFGQALEKGPAYTAPNFGDKAQIASDTAYAKSRANYYYKKLANKSMTAAAVLKAVRNDQKLSFALPNNKFLSQSTQFGNENNTPWRSQVFYPDIANYITSQSRTGLSTVRTGKINVGSGAKSTTSSVDGYYYIVQLDQAKQAGISNANDFTKTVNQIAAQYKGW